jgi:4-amino-4-deoxy-L-arabinose transferase-like glycosyltransferase
MVEMWRGRWWPELALLLLVVAAALLFRLPGLAAVPEGLHHDEAIDLRQGLLVLEGARFIYTAEGWGREALFYYPLALMLQLVTDNVTALRATVVLFSIGVIGVNYLLARRFAGPLAAWLTAAWLAVNYWALFTSRFGVRHISLPLIMGMAALAFWWAWDEEEAYGRYAVAGLLLGLTLYTYQPARFALVLFAGFMAYLLLVHREQLRRRWRGLAVFGAAALLVTVPLAAVLAADNIENSSRAWTIEPLLELMAGNVRPILSNVLAIAGMFTVAGDPLPAYNVPGRPVFQPAVTGLFFYVGLALALLRWRRPVYAFLLLWLVVMLLPSLVTIDAPNYNRAIAAQFPVFFLAALPVVEAVQWLGARRKKTAALLPVALALLALILTGAATWRDYFTVWPQERELALLYHPHATAIARYLDGSDSRPAIISSRNFEHIDPLIVSVSANNKTDVRWLDTGQALAWPGGAAARLVLASDRWIDGTLSAAVGMPPQSEMSSDWFAVFDLPRPEWPAAGLAGLPYLPAGAPWPEDPATLPVVALPASFAGKVRLVSLDLHTPDVPAGETVTAVTRWQVQATAGAFPLAFFVHLLDAGEQIVAQQDGLGYPPHTWRPGDQFLQVHHLSTSPSIPPGRYRLLLGLYHRDTGERWLLTDPDGMPLGDRLLLGAVEIR